MGQQVIFKSTFGLNDATNVSERIQFLCESKEILIKRVGELLDKINKLDNEIRLLEGVPKCQ